MRGVLLAEQQGRIFDVPVNTDLPVHTAWDIGVDDAMAIWCFQVYPDHIDVVDYYEGHGQGFDHYCEWLDARGYHGTPRRRAPGQQPRGLAIRHCAKLEESIARGWQDKDWSCFTDIDRG
jgi:hypothetical protein